MFLRVFLLGGSAFLRFVREVVRVFFVVLCVHTLFVAFGYLLSLFDFQFVCLVCFSLSTFIF